MKKTHSLFLLVPLFLGCMVFMYLALAGCVRDVVLDAGEKPRVVVECVLTESSPQELRLSFTKGASLAEAPELTAATAWLTDLTDNYPAGEFRRREDGVWVLDYAAVPRHSYRLEVEVPGYDLVWAEQTMPEGITVETKVHSIPAPPWSSSSGFYSFMSYRMTDYVRSLWLCGVFYYVSAAEEKNYVGRVCADYPGIDAFNLTGDIYSPEIMGEGTVFSAAIYGSLYGKPLYRRFIYIRDASPDHRFVVSGDFPGDYSEQAGHCKMAIRFSSFSLDYDQYLKQAVMIVDSDGASELTSVFARDNLYSNIHGGIGIFGACTSTTEEWLRGYQYIETG